MPEADAPTLASSLRASELGADVALLADAARAAGAVALGYFGQSPEIWTKTGGSPVSEADLAADRLLRAMLIGARPDHGWLSEETADTPARLTAMRLFVVDPIDGTRAFLAGDPRWTVSVALVEAGRPIAAALYQPATGEMMLAALGKGAWKNDAPMRPSGQPALSGARITGPKRFFGAEEAVTTLGLTLQPYVPSLALRIAQIADGRADISFASEKSHDWDLAAADLLVHEAGGILTDLDGGILAYNRPSPRHPALVATGPVLHAESRALLGTLIGHGGRTRG